LALSFFFGDEFGSLASFLVDAVAAVPLAGCLRRGIIRPRSVSGQTVCGGMSSSPVSRSSAENMLVPWGSVVLLLGSEGGFALRCNDFRPLTGPVSPYAATAFTSEATSAGHS